MENLEKLTNFLNRIAQRVNTIRSYSVKDSVGEVISIDSNEINFQGEILAWVDGSYEISLDEGDFSTSGDGEGLILNVSIDTSTNAATSALYVSRNTFVVDIISGGSGFVSGDTLTVPYSILGLQDIGQAEVTLTDQNIDGVIGEPFEKLSGIDISAERGVYIYGSIISIDPSLLPTQEPRQEGVLWVDGRGALRVSGSYASIGDSLDPSDPSLVLM
jgi:hypothetical protein